MSCNGPLRGVREVALSLCMMAGLASWGAPTANAAPVPLPANATLSTLIGLSATGGVQIGNLVFSDFSYSSSPTTGANIAPNSSQVTVSTAPGPNTGLTFSSFWQSAGQNNQDSIIRYSVTAVSGVIDQVNLAFNGAAPLPDPPGPPAPLTRASVVETVSTLVGGGAGTTLGQTSVANSTAGGATTTNNSSFTVSPARSSIYVSKDVQVNSSSTGVSTISWVDNTYHTSPVPEPGSLGLLGVVGAGLLARRRRA